MRSDKSPYKHSTSSNQEKREGKIWEKRYLDTEGETFYSDLPSDALIGEEEQAGKKVSRHRGRNLLPQPCQLMYS